MPGIMIKPPSIFPLMNFKELEDYINYIQETEKTFRNQNLPDISGTKGSKSYRILEQLSLSMLSIVDSIHLILLLKLRKHTVKSKRIVYTGQGSCFEVNGKLEDRIVKPLFSDNILFINSQKGIRIKMVNNQKVFNLGSLVKVMSNLFFRNLSYKMRVYKAYSTVNDILLKHLNGNEVYVICLWEMNTLSIVFSKYRSKIKLIKVQHGSMINYPPYLKPSPAKVADLIYVRNKPTIDFLKNHLCALYPTEYKLIPYPDKNRVYVPGVHIFYASTIEINGLHPVFLDFLVKNTDPSLHVILRLHPRERMREKEFAAGLVNCQGKFEFDNSKNWLEGNNISNLIVVSPWSSTLEEAFDNGLIAITIDPVGKSRFSHYIDSKTFFYSENLAKTLTLIGTVTQKSIIR